MVLFQTSYFANEYRSKEALKQGYKSTLSKTDFFCTRDGQFLSSSLWQIQWSHRVLLGSKWRIQISSFHWCPRVFWRLRGLVTRRSVSEKIVWNHWFLVRRWYQVSWVRSSKHWVESRSCQYPIFFFKPLGIT